MNTAQISALQDPLQKISDTDINAKITPVFINQDLEAVRIGQYSVPDYVAIIKRITVQFTEEIIVNGLYLPMGYSVEINTQYNIQTDITTLSNTLNAPNLQSLSASVPIIERLVHYQIRYGFWDKSTRKIHSADDVKIKDLETKLGYMADQLKEGIAKLEESRKQLDGEKTKLTQFTTQKQQELQQITNNLQSTNTTNQQVSQLLTTATATNGKIDTIKVSADQS